LNIILKILKVFFYSETPGSRFTWERSAPPGKPPTSRNNGGKTMKYKLVTYYPKSDEDFDGDYVSVALFDENGKEIVSYGDYYHDKGDEKMEGFIDGLKYILGQDIVIEEEDEFDPSY
jgi:hypothetical protein